MTHSLDQKEKTDYLLWNEALLRYFFNDDVRGQKILLAIDDVVINEVGKTIPSQINKSYDITNFLSATRTPNSSLLRKFDQTGIPLGMAFIALEILTASRMHKGETYTAAAYNPRFKEVIELSDCSLDKFYQGVQERIWEDLEKWALKNDFEVNFPASRTGKGRYVQFPLSQALLNRSDLDKIPLLFKKSGLSPFDFFSYGDFVDIIKDCDSGNYLSSHFYKLKERLNKDGNIDLLYHQIFNYYCSWDDELSSLSPKSPGEYTSKNRPQFVKQLCINKKENRIQVLESNKECYSESLDSLNELNKLGEYCHIHDDELLFFVKDEVYGDWCYKPKIPYNQETIILCRKGYKDYDEMNRLGLSDIQFVNFYKYKVTITEKQKLSLFWKKYVQKRAKIPLDGGLKISHNVWLEGAGPNLVFTDFSGEKIWVNGSRITLNSKGVFSFRDYPVNTYKVITQGFSPISFSIKDKEEFSPLKGVTSGWKISKVDKRWEYSNDDYQMSGLSINFPDTTEKQNSVRHWADLLTRKEKGKSGAVILETIRRSKYEI